MTKKHPEIIKKKRPLDTDITQQRIKTFPNNVSPLYLSVAFVVIGILFIPTGTTLIKSANNTVEYMSTYDDGTPSSPCYISSSNQGRMCDIVFSFDQKVDGPIYLYYQLENFFQNHRRYYQSLDRSQLQGSNLKESDVSLSCSPLYKNGSLLLNPCGLIANSFFNDVFSIRNTVGSDFSLDESNIAIKSDRDTLFKQVSGFQSVEVTSSNVSCSSVNLPTGCKYYVDNSGAQYLYYYPDEDTVQYLYETYPNQISPIDGVTDEHFMVWMKPSILPTFRKLYGTINGTFEEGQKLVVSVTANYEVASFDATKSLVISSLGDYGGKNIFPGQAYFTVGIFSLVFGIFLFIKEKWLCKSG